MPEKPFDTTTRQLIQVDPAAWLSLAGLSTSAPVSIIDSEISTAIAIVDKVIHVGDDPPWLAHVEIQASHDSRLADRLLLYYALLNHRHRLPTRSIVILARPEADGPDLTGTVRHPRGADDPHLLLRYQILRLWQLPVGALLNGGLATLPLAPISDLGAQPVESVIRRMEHRLNSEASVADRRDLWTATLLLMGLRYNPGEATQLLRGVMNMRESATYQAILDEGRVEGRLEGRTEGRADEARHILLTLGSRRFGPAPAAVARTIASMTDPEALERLTDRLLDASSWSELLA
ncbi:MAG: hypothetical protein U0821_08785 [Chloroflexota bacterium]